MKAILIVDMPSMCKECPLCYDDCICDIIGDVTDDDSVDMRCPLRPLPQKVEMDMNEYYEGVADGWNDCLDALLGENENG